MFKNQKSQTLKTKIFVIILTIKKLEKHVIYSFMIILLQKNIIKEYNKLCNLYNYLILD